MRHRQPARRWGAVAVLALSFAACDSDDEVQVVDFSKPELARQLEPMARAIGDSRIVLLGENGHGVGEFSEAKVELVKWLHETQGFDVIAFESGFFECGHVSRQIDSLPTRDALLRCLSHAFQHAELLPLFEHIRESRSRARPLTLAGIDIQAQGFDSEVRPAALHAALSASDPALAARVATLDTALFLPSSSGGLGDSVYAWAATFGDQAKQRYDSAATLSSGWTRWAFRTAVGWVDRLGVRGGAEAGGSERPASYYELRDEWMARAVGALADSIAGPRKVVVWLHNDHARYGRFALGGYEIRSAGDFLREQYGEAVFSIGFFMGRGTIVDNGRNEHPVAPPDSAGLERFLAVAGAPASYLILRGNTAPTIRAWADGSQGYLRMGITPLSMVPANEFDALVYVDSVGPPNYRLSPP